MNARPFTIGVPTSGGDVSGMNAAIRAAVLSAIANNPQIVLIAIVAAAALAFGLGGRDVVAQQLGKWFSRGGT